QIGPSAIKSTPKGNQILWNFSKQLILNESLGVDEHTDLLVMGFSATDYIGHQFGPDAEHTKDTYTKLDQTIAEMLLFFDKQFGKKNYTIMLTSDHGAATSPNVLKKMKFNGGRFNSRNLLLALNRYLFDVFGQDQLVSKEINMQFYLNFDIINSAGIEFDLLFQKIKHFLESKEFIKSVYDLRSNSFSINENEIKMIKNGFHPKRSGDIFYVLSPGYIEWRRETGTTHASHYNYDTHVPLVFYGNGVQKKKLIDKRVHITDIAPTLSIIMKSSFPSGCTGNPIEEVISEN
ncbi:MAG: alkaline phosphatase family protein, partial [Bacteroidota bacterium]|nr:alkaline phosphatase family protein [Bacteroidota bacterium]